MGCVGDALDGGFQVTQAVGLGHDGDVSQGCSCACCVGGVDVGCGSAVAEGVCLEFFVEQRYGRGGGSCRMVSVDGGACFCSGRCRFRWSRCVGGELCAGHILHFLKYGCMLGGVVPLQREGVHVAIGGVGYGDHLMEIRGDANELG